MRIVIAGLVLMILGCNQPMELDPGCSRNYLVSDSIWALPDTSLLVADSALVKVCWR
jgi:hypothetical protein